MPFPPRISAFFYDVCSVIHLFLRFRLIHSLNTAQIVNFTQLIDLLKF
ncbi:unknown protein [Cronobacter turicensis z3032]|uniref:Uncharacterized protein n=1 Tax=Cronobacter turicensis (strain DSM 18703 / CCUG 55852 / LMG 23827 / z3032) TaxID=693216 RepID=C9XTI9_CROTZ|nr:unknown protein [Cronobacter turicensis z3032]